MIVNAPPAGRDRGDVRGDEGVETVRGKTVDNVWRTRCRRGNVEPVEKREVTHSASHSAGTGLKPVRRNGLRKGERGFPRLHTLYYYY